jgi:hypothetical protein
MLAWRQVSFGPFLSTFLCVFEPLARTWCTRKTSPAALMDRPGTMRSDEPRAMTQGPLLSRSAAVPRLARRGVRRGGGGDVPRVSATAMGPLALHPRHSGTVRQTLLCAVCRTWTSCLGGWRQAAWSAGARSSAVASTVSGTSSGPRLPSLGMPLRSCRVRWALATGDLARALIPSSRERQCAAAGSRSNSARARPRPLPSCRRGVDPATTTQRASVLERRSEAAVI